MNGDFWFAFFLATVAVLALAFVATYVLEAWRLSRKRPAVRVRVRRGFLR